jgi:hypothetical protein
MGTNDIQGIGKGVHRVKPCHNPVLSCSSVVPAIYFFFITLEKVRHLEVGLEEFKLYLLHS